MQSCISSEQIIGFDGVYVHCKFTLNAANQELAQRFKPAGIVGRDRTQVCLDPDAESLSQGRQQLISYLFENNFEWLCPWHVQASEAREAAGGGGSRKRSRGQTEEELSPELLAAMERQERADRCPHD